MTDKIRWGILATADIAKGQMIPAIKETSNSIVAAVSSRSLEKAQAFADENDIPKAYGSYQELLDAPDIDAIYNPLPVSMHSEWSIKAAEAGKPVLCEKPIAATADEAIKMYDAFEEKGLLLYEGLMYRYHDLTRTALKMIQDGAIGTPRVLHSQFNVGLEEGNIRFRRDMGGGAVLDLGVYCISILRKMAGQEPDDIQASGTLNDEKIDVSTAGTLHFPNGMVAHFGCGLLSTFNCEYGASGTEGRILIDNGAMCAWPGEAFKIKYWHGDDYEEVETKPTNHYTLMVEDFANALMNNTKPQYGNEDTINNLKVSDAVLKAVGYY
jgi:D-xylose 1-dehydrogenase (NADP+, D-xylono-1,5-lactone-forming)